MSLLVMIEDMLAAVTPHVFEALTVEYPALAPYPNPGAVVEVLRDEARPWSEKLAVTRTLLSGYQTGPRLVFAGLLLGGFARMLRELRREVGNWAPMAPEDIDQLVLSTFLAAAQYVSPVRAREMVVKRLEQRTRELLLGAAKRELVFYKECCRDNRFRVESKLETDAAPGEVDVWDSPAAQCLVEPKTPDVLIPTVAQVLAKWGDRFSERTRQVLHLYATIPDDTLVEYIERTTPGDDKERRRKYLALKKREERARNEVRKVLGLDDEPSEEPSE